MINKRELDLRLWNYLAYTNLIQGTARSYEKMKECKRMKGYFIGDQKIRLNKGEKC